MEKAGKRTAAFPRFPYTWNFKYDWYSVNQIDALGFLKAGVGLLLLCSFQLGHAAAEIRGFLGAGLTQRGGGPATNFGSTEGVLGAANPRLMGSEQLRVVLEPVVASPI